MWCGVVCIASSQDNIDPAIIEALQPLLKNPDFQPAKIKKVSQAAYGLCNWVRAMDTYDRVVKVSAGAGTALLGHECSIRAWGCKGA